VNQFQHKKQKQNFSFQPMEKTNQQYDQVIAICRNIFSKKMTDYGTAWRILRTTSLTDQIYIKAQRIRSIEEKGVSKVDEGVKPEFIGIINYCIIGLIQLELGPSDEEMGNDKTQALYDNYFQEAKTLMMAKNHDYGEAWRNMRISSYTDLILMKLKRTKQIEDNKGQTIMSEGIDANYLDMINYAVFAMIKIEFENED
jgi:predicted DNA binding CopG/RHH family protein